MLGTIREIVDNNVILDLTIDITKQANLLNLHVIFEDNGTKIVGEIVNSTKTTLKINIVGEIKGDRFLPGISAKPSFRSTTRIVNMDELSLILGPMEPTEKEVTFGMSNIYQNYKINVDINGFFSNHFAILGNSGAGKSFSVSRILQNVFADPKKSPVGAHVIMFDAYGEYTRALGNIDKVNPNMHYKTYTTNPENTMSEILNIPLWLLGVDDLALLLDAYY